MEITNKKFYVKKASKADIHSLIELRSYLLTSGNGSYVSLSTEWKINYEYWLNKWLENNELNKCVFVSLTNNEKICGCITGIIDERAPTNGCLNGLTGWIQSFIVLPEYRNRKIGEKLIETTLNWFKTSGVNKVFLQATNESINFYNKNKWIDTNELMLYKSINE